MYRRPFKLTRTYAFSLSAAILACSGIAHHSHAQQDGLNADPHRADATLVEIMDAIVMPAADTLWNAVTVEMTADGDIEKVPETDEEWAKLRRAAEQLAQSAEMIAVPGRTLEPVGTEHPEYELNTAQMTALVEAKWSDWLADANTLHDAAMQSIQMIDARNVSGLSIVGGDLDAACESCHQQFWYPSN